MIAYPASINDAQPAGLHSITGLAGEPIRDRVAKEERGFDAFGVNRIKDC